MNIAVVGIGYVGLVSAACFAELGAVVYCVDVDRDKIEGLREGRIPIYEPGLEQLVRRGLEGGRLIFETDLARVLPEVEIAFCAVGTPARADGSADLSYVLEVAHSIGRHLERYCLVVTKSTVPVGTSRLVREAIEQGLKERGVSIKFDVASNPEFLKEGNAIDDFMKPDRVVVGVDSPRARELMTRLYKPMLLSNFRVLFMDIASAEMTKYAANAMLATRISFINEIALLCERVGADVGMVRMGIGTDTRIGSKFLYAGCGYGGSCFPKDVQALIHTAHSHGCQMRILEAVEQVNRAQKEVLFERFSRFYNGQVKGRHAAVWGLAFKPGTDDIREAPSLVLIDRLLEAGCTVSVYDPVAMPEARRVLGDRVSYARDIYESTLGADVLFHVTEWKEYRMPAWEVIQKAMRSPLLIDGRNVFDQAPEEAGIRKLSIGVAERDGL
ncbi:UDP-glucose/GDP-mannose dehydrogenase family protein [Porphyromonas sp. COT-239 OH1446]|uniref:UDP-glucose dehydrogenase family protein n=1 Tax=Porphyromonas sp. COT-239 OH1446 TaxID=1515613 RepID=UPI00052D19C4|nr:UDP-glucose/GDP-mannose dehydrogenase family protein [Porphyromonas sp. COT-239 OH1446]KGN70038.1 UDP-glucose 6-dehydrogenase [Porphyromonas sp. COT-239 OH1446]